MKLKVWLLLFFAAGALPVQAQEATDFKILDPRIHNIIKIYADSVGGYNLLYQGAEYTHIYPGTVGHPFFKQPIFKNGLIISQGIIYPDVPILYDLVTGDLITKNSDQVRIILNPEKIERFIIGPDQFIQLHISDTTQKLQGYFRILYEGNIKILVMTFKVTKRSLRAEDFYTFKQYDRYYVLQENNLIPVTNTKTLINAFPHQSELLRKYLKINRLQFNRKPGKTMEAVTEWYKNLKL